MKYFRFLQNKVSGYTFMTLIRLEFESLFFGICGLIPTTLGVLIRALVCKIFFKSSAGFVWMQPRVILVHSDRISVGTNFGINSGCYVNGVGCIEIGSHVLIGGNVTISSGRHPIEGRFPTIFARKSVPEKIVIGDDVWIGAGAVILPGVTIASGTVIGANAVVTKDTQEYAVVVGAPARRVRTRTES